MKREVLGRDLEGRSGDQEVKLPPSHLYRDTQSESSLYCLLSAERKTNVSLVALPASMLPRCDEGVSGLFFLNPW